MKLILGIITLFLVGCGSDMPEKPDNLIAEDKMISIFYDLALLEAIRTQRPLVLQQANIQPNAYIFKKYKIDSIQFAKSNQYYAADPKRYRELYTAVANKIEQAKKTSSTPNNTGVLPSGPQIQ